MQLLFCWTPRVYSYKSCDLSWMHFGLCVFPTLLALFGLATGRDRKHVKRGTNGTNDKAKATESICGRSVLSTVFRSWDGAISAQGNRLNDSTGSFAFYSTCFPSMFKSNSLTPCLEDHTISRFTEGVLLLLRPLQEKLSPLSNFPTLVHFVEAMRHSCLFGSVQRPTNGARWIRMSAGGQVIILLW